MARKRVLSIEIGFSKTKVCEADYGVNKPKVYKCIIFDTPENTIEDAYIRDRAAFVDTLTRQLELADIRCKEVVFSILSNKILSREAVIPITKDKYISGIIEASKNEYFPMDISEHEIAYSIIEKNIVENQIKLMVYAFPGSLIRNYTNLAEELGMHVAGFDYAGNSVYQCMKKSKTQQDEHISCMLQINEQSTLFTVIEGTVLSLQRSINYGTNAMVEAAKKCDVFLELNPWDTIAKMQKTKYIKRRFDEAAGFESGRGDQKELDAQDTITESIRPLVANTLRVIEFYTTRNKDAKITRIQVVGIGATVIGIKSLLENEIGIRVDVVTRIPGISMVKTAAPMADRGSELVDCLGAILSPVNFTKISFAIEKKETPIRRYIILTIGVAVACALLVGITATSYALSVHHQNEIKKEYKELEGIEEVYNKYVDVIAAESELSALCSLQYQNSEQFVQVLKAIEDVVPSNTTISSMTYTNASVSFTCTVLSKTEAEKLLLQIQTIPYFNAFITSAITEKNAEGGFGVYEFSVTCLFKSLVNLQEVK